MKTLNIRLLMAVIVLLAISQQACKSKKIVTQPAAEVVAVEKEEPVVEKQPEETVVEAPAPTPVVEKPNFDFRNIQFEFDSQVLKTDSYGTLDQIAREMKKDPSVKFIIHGHASIEGTAAHNMALSVDRASAVKLYLVNDGVNADNLTTKAHGASQPTASNDTEDGRSLNRRVEIKVVR